MHKLVTTDHVGQFAGNNKLYIVLSCWTIIDIVSRCTDPWTL